MTIQSTRREILRGGLAAAGLGVLGIPEWALPALAQGETLVPFTDIPENVRWETPPDRRMLDFRTLEGPFTPKDKFATTQHYGHPDVDPATFKLKVTGLVDRPKALSLDDLKKIGSTDLVAGFECSGNRGPLQGLCGNGKWTGVPLKTVLDSAGVKAPAREFVFFGADHGEEEIEWRTQKFKLDQQYGRSLSREKALSPEPFLAWALNGEPLTKHQGAPLRLLVPGWYGDGERQMARADPRAGRAVPRQVPGALVPHAPRRDDRRRDEVGGDRRSRHMNPKSFIARVTKDGSRHKVLGVVLNDGTPIKTVEVKVDEGPWQAATMDPSTKDKFGWKFFTYAWNGATPGAHTLVSRVTDATGKVQPTEQDLETKKSFLEHNPQSPRKVMVS